MQPTGGSYDLHVTALQQRRELRQASASRQLVVNLHAMDLEVSRVSNVQ